MKKFFSLFTKKLICKVLQITLYRGPFLTFIAFLVTCLVLTSIYGEPSWQFKVPPILIAGELVGALIILLSSLVLFFNYDGWNTSSC
jgi:hypothetical protein